jgi:hypothetical protein
MMHHPAMDISFCLPRTRRGRAEHSRTRNATHALASRVAQQGQTGQLVHRTKLSALWITVSLAQAKPLCSHTYGSHQHWQHMAQVQNVLMLRQRGEGTQHAKGPRTQRGETRTLSTQSTQPRLWASTSGRRPPRGWQRDWQRVVRWGAREGAVEGRAMSCSVDLAGGESPLLPKTTASWLGCGSLTPLVGWLAPPVQPRAPAPQWLTIPATRTHDVFDVPDGCGVKQTRAPQQRDKGGQSDGDQVNPSPCTSCQFKAP